MATRVTVTFMTRYGVSFTCRFYVPASVVDPDDAIILAVVAAINDACACVGFRIEITQGGSFVQSPGSGPTVCEDKAVIIVPDDSGEAHTFKLPAPKLAGGTSIFETDGATLDLADASVAALSTALATYGYGASGDNLTPIKKGHRAGGKRLAH